MTLPTSSSNAAGRLLLVDDRSNSPAGFLDPLDIGPFTSLGLATFRVGGLGALKEAFDQGPWDVVVVVWPTSSSDIPPALRTAVAEDPSMIVLAVSASAEVDIDDRAARAAMGSGARFLVPAHQRGVLGLVIDRELSERRRAGTLERVHGLILEAAGEGIYGVDTRGAVTFVNPAAGRMIGWERHELLGRLQHAVLHHTRPDGTPYPKEECPIYAAFSDGQVHHVDTEVFFRKDGSKFPVDYISTPIREQGALVGAVVTFRDISDRKAAEQAIAEHRHRLETSQRELVTALGQLVATEDMVLASQSVAAALLPVRDALKALSHLVQGEEAARHVRRAESLLETLGHLAADAAPAREVRDIAADIVGALPATMARVSTAGPVEARVAPDDLRVAVAQIVSLLGPDVSVDVRGDDGVPSVHIEGSLPGPPGVAMLFARRLIGRNAGALETVQRPPDRVLFIIRLASPRSYDFE